MSSSSSDSQWQRLEQLAERERLAWSTEDEGPNDNTSSRGTTTPTMTKTSKAEGDEEEKLGAAYEGAGLVPMPRAPRLDAFIRQRGSSYEISLTYRCDAQAPKPASRRRKHYVRSRISSVPSTSTLREEEEEEESPRVTPFQHQACSSKSSWSAAAASPVRVLWSERDMGRGVYLLGKKVAGHARSQKGGSSI